MNTLFVKCYFEQIKFLQNVENSSTRTNKFRKILIYFPIRTNKFRKFYLTTTYYSHFFLPRKFLLAQISSLKVIHAPLFHSDVNHVKNQNSHTTLHLHILHRPIDFSLIILEKTSSKTLNEYR